VNKVQSADFAACLLIEKYPGIDAGKIKNVANAHNCHRPTSHERLGGVHSGHMNVFGNKVQAGAINSWIIA